MSGITLSPLQAGAVAAIKDQRSRGGVMAGAEIGPEPLPRGIGHVDHARVTALGAVRVADQPVLVDRGAQRVG